MFFYVFDFFQKTNENKSNWDTIVVKLNSFVRFLEESSAWKNHYDFVWPLAYLFRIHLYAYLRQLLIKSGQKCGTVKSQKNRPTMAAFGNFFPKSIRDKSHFEVSTSKKKTTKNRGTSFTSTFEIDKIKVHLFL